jgi:hypothetical protein
MVSTTQKIIIGFLVLVVLTASVYILLPGKVRIDVQDTKTTFKVWENNSWILAGTEYTKIYDGTTLMKANNRVVNFTANIEENKTTIYRYSYFKENISVIDIYNFDGAKDDVELVPISHEIQVNNGKDKILVYEVNDLLYSGETINPVESPQEFGHNMKVEWEEGNYYSRIFKYSGKNVGKLEVKYRIDSGFFEKSVRLFDPYYSVNNFNGTTSESLYFFGKSNSTRYLVINHNAVITNATLRVAGSLNYYNGTNYSFTANNGDARGICFDGTYFYVTDAFDDEVYRYSSSWAYSSSWDTGTGRDDPWGCYSDGTYIWIVDTIDTDVNKYYLNGTYIGNFDIGASGATDPYGLTGDGTYFWVSDDATKKAYKYWMNGTYTGEYWTIDNIVWGLATNGTYIWGLSYFGGVIKTYYMNGTPTGETFSTYFGSSYGIEFAGGSLYVVHGADVDKVSKYNIIGSAPSNPYLYVSSSKVWNYSGNFVSAEYTNNFPSVLNSALNSGDCDCTGCSLSGTNCSIPFIFHSDTSGILTYSNINVTLELNYILQITDPTTENPKSVTSGDNISITFNALENGANLTTGIAINNVTIGGTEANILTSSSINGTINVSIPSSCSDIYHNVQIEAYSNWTTTGSGKINVTKFYWWQYDTSMSTTELVRIRIYYSNGTGIEGSNITVNGTGASAWAYANYTTPFEITLGNSYIVGMALMGTGGTYNSARDTSSDCANYLPNQGSWYTSTGDNVLDTNVPFTSQSTYHYGIFGVGYNTYGDADQFTYSSGIGWILNVTTPVFESGLKDLFLNVSYGSFEITSTETNSISYGVSDTCTCAGSGANWVVNMPDNCTLSTPCNIGTGNLSWTGVSGYFNCSAQLNLTNRNAPPSGTVFYFSNGCEVNRL